MQTTPVRYALATDVDVVAQAVEPGVLPFEIAAVYQYWTEKREGSFAPA